ncbi:hypothetical protein AB595_21925 [Massilia sp. WF1]|uniref:tetratricopeptide repeat protein n=1 Tax=unclassified Massilia TaxID=2609279 RepID=UPI00064B3985|nr:MULTISPECIES: tetratricopeptide repeat protein [unclassified Massilia]ALK97073.1 hypothetical protein AM586_13260 [Massilia sp. WG5]KLU34749.1 hypothetical protein AB595_21925 [Massilia sp. WF1]
MSLINKMLQDLDARGTPGAESFPSQTRPVARERAGVAGRIGLRRIAAASGGAAAAVALSWFGWTNYQQARAVARPAAPAAAPLKPAAIKPAAAPVVGTLPAIPATEVPVPASAPAPIGQPADAFDAPVAAPKQPAASVPKSVAGYEPDSAEARTARQAIMAELQARIGAGILGPAARLRAAKPETPGEARHAPNSRPKAEEGREHRIAARAAPAADADMAAPASRNRRGGAQGLQESAPQRAEGEYRRALASLQDGRMEDTIAALEQALKLDPAHDAARQTLVGLLIEAKRSDEAIRHLQAGLALDARQPALAMLLARLQIERGGSGIETLTRTLPYAGNGTGSSADYHAFLAGALQREQRYREAAVEYQAALRVSPGNGVWWMGLGMSLQAGKRNAEAREAFQRAHASGTLAPELQAFVESRLQQLGR